MHYVIKKSRDINIQDINEIFESVKWDKRNDIKWKSVIEKSTFLVEVIKDGKTIGFARTLDDSDYCMIYDVVVHADFQHQGIGTIIMEEILKYVKSKDFTIVRLFYWMNNAGLSEFYERFGFEKMSNGMGLKK